MINVEAEVNKHKNCKNKDELAMIIKGYKSLALQNASDLMMAGQINSVVFKLQEICDKLPAAPLKKIPTGRSDAQTKTAKITNEEKAKINAAWKKKAGSTG
ncbi:MAG: hypothetical protein FWC06_00455 [Treponema sp.]|nr:hypothetical protein [Treponema sp.]